MVQPDTWLGLCRLKFIADCQRKVLAGLLLDIKVSGKDQEGDFENNLG